MKHALILFVFLLSFISAVNAQTKRFSNEEMQKCRVYDYNRYEVCENKVTNGWTDLSHSPDIHFTKIRYNLKNKLLKIKGRMGFKFRMPVFILFIADIKEGGNLSNNIIVGATQFPKFPNQKYSFSFRVVIEGNELLFIYNEEFILSEYDLSCLLEKK